MMVRCFNNMVSGGKSVFLFRCFPVCLLLLLGNFATPAQNGPITFVRLALAVVLITLQYFSFPAQDQYALVFGSANFKSKSSMHYLCGSIHFSQKELQLLLTARRGKPNQHKSYYHPSNMHRAQHKWCVSQFLVLGYCLGFFKCMFNPHPFTSNSIWSGT